MRFGYPDTHTCEIAAIPVFYADLLRHIPDAAEPGRHRAARRRLFSSPTADPNDALAADWAEHVQPELERLFSSAAATVAQDLQGLKAERRRTSQSATYRIRFPKANAEAWLSALNQARLVIGERIGYREEEPLDPIETPLSARTAQIVQIEFYALLQEWLLDGLMGG